MARAVIRKSQLGPQKPGTKFDDQKPRPELVVRGFARALLAVSQVATYGAQKYSDDGWEHVPNGIQRYTDALYRHLLAEHSGEALDPESKLSHAAHACWNAIARLELIIRESNARSAQE